MATPVRDLHKHSNCSDGLFPPSDLVKHPAESGVEEFSLTDHDTIAGLDEAQATADELGMRFVPGIELTCRFGGLTVHVLGYRFQTSALLADTRLAAYLAEVKQRDHERAHRMCAMTCDSPLIVKTDSGEEHRLCVTPEELSWVRGTIPTPIHLAVVLSAKLGAICGELRIPAQHCMYLFTTAGTDFHDPHHRAQVAPGRDRAGRHLGDGVSAVDLTMFG